MGVLFCMTLVHVSAILSGILADTHDMGRKARIRATRKGPDRGSPLQSHKAELLTSDDQEMVEEFLANMGIEGDLAGRQFVVFVQEEERTVTFDDEGRMITSERSHA